MADVKKVSEKPVFDIVLSTYLGERCKYCGKLYETLEDLEETVWAGYHDKGRLACMSCYSEKYGA